MLVFNYKIKCKEGLHARPAVSLINKAREFSSLIEIRLRGQNISLQSNIYNLMGLGLKCGDEIEVYINGIDETNAYNEIKDFFEKNL